MPRRRIPQRPAEAPCSRLYPLAARRPFSPRSGCVGRTTNAARTWSQAASSSGSPSRAFHLRCPQGCDRCSREGRNSRGRATCGWPCSPPTPRGDVGVGSIIRAGCRSTPRIRRKALRSGGGCRRRRLVAQSVGRGSRRRCVIRLSMLPPTWRLPAPIRVSWRARTARKNPSRSAQVFGVQRHQSRL